MIQVSAGDSGSQRMQDIAVDLTALLDILFVLLVFFMLTAGIALQSLDLKLPASDKANLPAPVPGAAAVLEIRPAGYAIDGQLVSDLDQLGALLAASSSDRNRRLIIAGDRDIPLQRLLEVLTYLKGQGVEAASILMQNRPKS
ncbi:MAG: biopolymer transporter ExbD [Betaproteobacteria bacterium]|nr:biopolymer transporter ExbD [Betaproteobacteria bacterium]